MHSPVWVSFIIGGWANFHDTLESMTTFWFRMLSVALPVIFIAMSSIAQATVQSISCFENKASPCSSMFNESLSAVCLRTETVTSRRIKHVFIATLPIVSGLFKDFQSSIYFMQILLCFFLGSYCILVLVYSCESQLNLYRINVVAIQSLYRRNWTKFTLLASYLFETVYPLVTCILVFPLADTYLEGRGHFASFGFKLTAFALGFVKVDPMKKIFPVYFDCSAYSSVQQERRLLMKTLCIFNLEYYRRITFTALWFFLALFTCLLSIQLIWKLSIVINAKLRAKIQKELRIDVLEGAETLSITDYLVLSKLKPHLIWGNFDELMTALTYMDFMNPYNTEAEQQHKEKMLSA